MKKLYSISVIAIIAIFSANQLNAQTIWTGEKITFTKANFADPTQEVAQDRITDSVWITRGAASGLYNIITESSDPDACSGPEPSGTEWAYGTTNDTALNYQPLGLLIGCNFANVVDSQEIVLHLIAEDIYIDFMFLSWTMGSQNGGGFSYERSSNIPASTNEIAYSEITLFPNPANNTIQVSGLTKNEKFTIFSILGDKIDEGNLNDREELNISSLVNGVYFIKIGDNQTIKFIKK